MWRIYFYLVMMLRTLIWATLVVIYTCAFIPGIIVVMLTHIDVLLEQRHVTIRRDKLK